MKRLFSKIAISASLLFFSVQIVNAQKSKNELAKDYRVVMHAVPFLVIAPDSRAGAMGELGAATEPDEWSLYWNPSKYGFIKKDFGIGLSYTPWLRNLQIRDVNELYLTAYKRYDSKQTFAGSFKYFYLGTIEFTNDLGIATGESYEPHEFALDLAYSRLLSKDFSFGLALRYINSNLTGGASNTPGEVSHAARTVAADVSGYYQKTKTFGGMPADLRFGFNISNMGGKISYLDAGRKDFLPANLRLGGGTTMKLDNYNDLGVNIEASKLLVPTPRYSYKDSAGNEYFQGSGDPLASSTVAMFNSFSDAPGGALEEWHEIAWSAGVEYWYVKQFALRGGYYYEHKTKGNRKFFTVGVGLRMTVFGLDAAYVVPTGGSDSPLANTWRISLTYEFEKAKQQTAQNASK